MPKFAERSPADLATRSNRQVEWKPFRQWPDRIYVRLDPSRDKQTFCTFDGVDHAEDGSPAGRYKIHDREDEYVWLWNDVAYTAELPPSPAIDSDIPL